MAERVRVVEVPAQDGQPEESWASKNRGLLIGLGIALVLVIGLVIWAVIAMVNNPAETETIRDVFIIFMALEALVIGMALVIVTVQLALLTNLLRHEIKPILDSTNEAARTVRGTTAFVSQNLVAPVIKLQASMAAVKSALDILRPNHRE